MIKNSNNITFNSNGKLLLTGEYVVLDGALALAIPTKYRQSLEIEPLSESKLIWKSLDEKETIWFENEFLICNGLLKQAQHNEISDRLLQILNTAKKLNPEFLNSKHGFKVKTKLDFPRDWGLGTSSTLINNIAQWANVDAYQLLEKSFGGSGYDIACAQFNTPITYQLLNDETLKQSRKLSGQHNEIRTINNINFDPSFKEHLYFVYLNQKQNSRDGIKLYKENSSHLSETILKISSITQSILLCRTLEEFILLIEKHENIISKITNQKTVKDLLFNDFNGGIKSLGAWGGDFILVASKNNPESYFIKKGLNTIIPYQDMVL